MQVVNLSQEVSLNIACRERINITPKDQDIWVNALLLVITAVAMTVALIVLWVYSNS